MALVIIRLTDIRDSLCKDKASQADIDTAHLMLLAIGRAMGLAEADIKQGTNADFIVREFLIERATMLTAQRCSGLTAEQIARGIMMDPYMKKYEQQKVLADEWEEKITREVLKGEADTTEEFSVGGEIVRG